MVAPDVSNPGKIAKRLRLQAEADALRFTLHAHQEMMEEGIECADVQAVLSEPEILENYPDHKRGPCCLVCGRDETGRFVHVVCTTTHEVAIIITVYEPKPPKWRSPVVRGERQ